MKVLIVFLMMLLGTESAVAERWTQPVIPVFDFSDDAWSPYVVDQVAAYNATMPRGVPPLVYIDKGPRACADIFQVKRAWRIIVCSGETDDGRSITQFGTRGGAIQTVRITFDPDDLSRAQYSTCHEFMHALTFIPDDYTNPHEGESCVQGTLNHLGPWDIAYAAQVYAAHDRSAHHRRHR